MRSIILSIFFALVLSYISPMGLCDEQSENREQVANKRIKTLKDLQNRDSIYDDDELFNKLFPYQTQSGKSNGLINVENNMIKPNNNIQPKIELDNTNNKDTSSSSKASDEQYLGDAGHVAPSSESGSQSFMKNVKDIEKAKSIAFNSREVRLIGPNQQEVEMKDDLASKFAVVMDNLRLEATDLYGKVNEKLDKGWTELKQNVDKLVEEGKKQVSKI